LPGAITAGPDGALWFTQFQPPRIGRITTAGVITEFSSPTRSADDITAGPDGALWFTAGDTIGRITTAGAATQFALAGVLAASIVAGPDGALWFTTENNANLVRMTTDGVATAVSLPAQADPVGGDHALTVGSDGGSGGGPVVWAAAWPVALRPRAWRDCAGTLLARRWRRGMHAPSAPRGAVPAGGASIGDEARGADATRTLLTAVT
jgi:streptogramin lyase